MKITVPTGSQSVIGKDGTVNPAWYTLFQKLANASSGKNYIETVWGRGYVLREPSDDEARVSA